MPSTSTTAQNVPKSPDPGQPGQSETRLSMNFLSNASVEAASKASDSLSSPSSMPSTPRSPTGRNPRTRGKVTIQATRLEAVDDGSGPLGPLGDGANTSEPEQPPVPPLKEQQASVRNMRQAPLQSPMNRSVPESSDAIDDDRSSTTSRQRYGQHGLVSPGLENIRRQTQPSVSIEQAARPTFDISVGDPHKVGDITSSHIVYQVRTKVRLDPCLRGDASNSMPDHIESI